jgi:predicted extracellular nuclease
MKLQYPILMVLLSASVAHASDVFINEIHYDNTGGDSGEAVEVAGPAGTDLSGWSLVRYNGNNGLAYGTTNLSGLLPNQQDSFGTTFELIQGLQNGSPDGIALVDNNGSVVQFLSYEGAFTALDGPANGLISTDIGVSEPGNTPVGFSLQLGGSGTTSDDFSWQEAMLNTFGAVNTNQTFSGDPAVDNAPVVIGTTPTDNSGVVALNADIEISFSESVNAVGNWFNINCSESGNHTASVNGGPQHYSLNPDVDFFGNEVCTVLVSAALVNDVDANDPPDFMEADYTFTFGSATNSTIVINEVDADTAGADTLEFIELYDGGVGNTPLDGLVVVLYNGSDNSSYNSAFDLDGFSTNSEGFFVLGNAAVVPTPSIIINDNNIQNGPDAVAVHLGNASDYPNDTPVSGYSLVDAVVYDTNDGDNQDLLSVLTPGQPQVNEGGAGDKDAHSNARVPDGGAALDTSVYLQQAPSPGISNVLVFEIFDIQGSGLTSPLEDQIVVSKDNVVTAIDTNGFFMQTPVSRSDNNDETSDGIFVFTGSAPTVSVGDEVSVTGQVVEFFNFTEFAGGSQIEINSSGNPLPPIVIFDENTPSSLQPQADNEMERYEGMIVTFTGIATAATDRFGDTAVVAGTVRAFREPGIAYPGLPGLPVWDGNPEIFEINPDGLMLDNETFFAGQSVSATGPLGYSFGDYQIWPTSLTIGPEPELLNKVRARENDEITVGSLNMFRPSQVADVYAARLNKISQFVLNVMDAPDILAVSEVDNIDVLQAIADQINADDITVDYTPYLIEGNDIGGIDVGFLIRQSVEMDAVTQMGKDTIFTYDDSLLNDRPPLLFSGRVVNDGSNFPIQVLVVHNRSLSNVDSSDRVRNKRLTQAQFVAGIVRDLQDADPNVNLVVTGDFNGYQFTDGYVDVLGQITGTSIEQDNLLWEPSPVQEVLTNQVNNLAANEQYSFVFNGSAQVLDHALTSKNLDKLVTGFQFARGNADSPANLVTDDSTALRSSDHDGVVLYIVKDTDNDSIADSLDMCPSTSVPETVPSKGLKPNRYALMDDDSFFDTEVRATGRFSLNPNKGKAKAAFSLADTAGCSCEQIVEQLDLGNGHLDHGCSKGVMKVWAKQVAK